jgi:hypothetical protein
MLKKRPDEFLLRAGRKMVTHIRPSAEACSKLTIVVHINDNAQSSHGHRIPAPQQSRTPTVI